MDTLTRDDLQALIEPRGGRCVSLYMPAFHKGAEQQQNLVRFSNLLRDAQHQLLAAEVGPAEADALLAPARRLATDAEFWRHPSDGVAAFMAPDFLRHYRLPIKFAEMVVATQHFEVRPLLPWVAATGRFYVLALGTEHARLFRCTAFGIREVHVQGMPVSIAEALNEEITGGREIQARGEAPRQPGERGTAFYGHGSERDYAKNKLLRFFRIVDRCLHPLLSDPHAPLVLAGVAYLQPIYREANTCRHLADDGVDGTPDVLGEEALRDRAWAIVEPLFLKRQNEALARYRQFAHTEHASSDIRQVAQAAREGRVETLFVAIEGQLWGSRNALNEGTQLHPTRETGDDEQLNLATILTLLHGGAVYAIGRESMADGALLAAVLRR